MTPRLAASLISPTSERRTADGVQAEVDHLQRQPEALAVRHARHIAQHHQSVEHPECGARIDAGGPRHFAQGHFGAFGREGFEHAQSLGQRIHQVPRIFGGRIFRGAAGFGRLAGARQSRTRCRGFAAASLVRWDAMDTQRGASILGNPVFGLRKYFLKTRMPSCAPCVNRTTRRTRMLCMQSNVRCVGVVFAASGFAVDCGRRKTGSVRLASALFFGQTLHV
jgi:hypothetical protein